MKAFPAIKMVGGALIVLASVNAYAQSSDAAPRSAAPMAASSALPSAKSDQGEPTAGMVMSAKSGSALCRRRRA